MGMTDMQFKAFLREAIDSLEETLALCADNEPAANKIKKTIARYEKALEG